MQVYVVLSEFTIGGRGKFSKEPIVFLTAEAAEAYLNKEMAKITDPWFKTFDGPVCTIWECAKQYVQFEVHTVTVRGE